jgi:hypothetical protein
VRVFRILESGDEMRKGSEEEEEGEEVTVGEDVLLCREVTTALTQYSPGEKARSS